MRQLKNENHGARGDGALQLPRAHWIGPEGRSAARGQLAARHPKSGTFLRIFERDQMFIK